MKNFIIWCTLVLPLLGGCGFVEETWEENREEIVETAIDAIEDEKEKDRLLNELIERLEEERKATIAPVSS